MRLTSDELQIIKTAIKRIEQNEDRYMCVALGEATAEVKLYPMAAYRDCHKKILSALNDIFVPERVPGSYASWKGLHYGIKKAHHSKKHRLTILSLLLATRGVL